MKIKPEHYAHMLAACKKIVERMPTRERYGIAYGDKVSDLNMRYRWDLMYAAGLLQYACDTLYKYADDTHIDTALKQIVKDLKL